MKLFIKHGNVLIIDVDGVEAHDKYIVLYVRIKIDLKNIYFDYSVDIFCNVE